MKKYELQQNLGSDDARKCNELGATIYVKDAEALKAGSVVKLSDEAHEYLTVTKEYTSLLSEPATFQAVAPTPEIRGVPKDATKSPYHGMNLPDALAKIPNAHKDTLQKAVEHDDRKGVVDAAQKRLDEMG